MSRERRKGHRETSVMISVFVRRGYCNMPEAT
jgi:hypothetical protein